MIPYVVLGFVLQLLYQTARAQEDYSDPIKCYFCVGRATNSSCSDPIDTRTRTDLVERECPRGVCLKWTYFVGGYLMMERTCSERLEFNIMLIDGVCRTESKGNGYLCMCGKHLCNTGRTSHNINIAHLALITISSLVTQHVWLLWRR